MMFDFEKLDVYQRAKSFNSEVYTYLISHDKLDLTTKDQLRRASFSVMLNMAEGTSRFTNADRRRFFIIARGSLFECVAIFDFLNTHQLLSKELHGNFYKKAEELSKIIYAIIKKLN